MDPQPDSFGVCVDPLGKTNLCGGTCSLRSTCICCWWIPGARPTGAGARSARRRRSRPTIAVSALSEPNSAASPPWRACSLDAASTTALAPAQVLAIAGAGERPHPSLAHRRSRVRWLADASQPQVRGRVAGPVAVSTGTSAGPGPNPWPVGLTSTRRLAD